MADYWTLISLAEVRVLMAGIIQISQSHFDPRILCDWAYVAANKKNITETVEIPKY